MISELMRDELSDEQIKADIMNRLLRKDCWGAKYLPVDTLVNWMGKQVKRNGRRVEKMIKELVREGYLFIHKKGGTISLNSSRSREIAEYIQNNLLK
jgi:DNA-binding transcriptional regulator YhcF (GntR family)